MKAPDIIHDNYFRLVLLLVVMTTTTDGGGVTESSDVTPCPMPDPCECEYMHQPDRLVVNCKQKYFDTIPSPVAGSDVMIDELTLADNVLSTIPDKAFIGLRIRRLDLTGNQLTNISGGAFDGLQETVEELLLELDESAEFPVQSLAALTGLRLLKVVGYRRASTLPPRALAPLTSLAVLSLRDGSLHNLSAADLDGQRTSLTELDLNSNKLDAVPTAAIASLKNLTVVELNQNVINVIANRSFGSASTLRRLSLDQNPISTIDPDAFAGLATSLRNLSMQSCRLQDRHLVALKTLLGLHNLVVAYNEITTVDRLIGDMSSLEVLSAMNNRITSLSGTTYRAAGASLRSINLAGNPLVDVAADTFVGMRALEELVLDGAHLSWLDADSFASQRGKLRVLSLKSANLSGSVWTAVNGLTALQFLWMPQCSLRDVPDFAFAAAGHLQTLDLDGNIIETLTPRALAGLHDSLEVITLNNNRLTTLDRCVFDRFTKIDILRVGLANNPLQCDCGLQWLYESLKPYRSDLRFDALPWRCANLAGRRFNNLTDSDFVQCGLVATSAAPCENLMPTTSPPITFPVDPSIQLYINSTSAYSITMSWIVEITQNVDSMAVTYQRRSSSVAVRQDVDKVAANGTLTLTQLNPNTTYIICLEVKTSSAGTVKSCTEAQTTLAGPDSQSASMQLILGVAIGGGLALIVIIVVVIVCVCRQQERQRISKRTPQSPTAPKQSFQTKHYRKRAAGGGASSDPRTSGSLANMTDADVDRAIGQTLERLNPESKEALANLLRSASAASLDRLGGASTFYPPSGYYQHRGGGHLTAAAGGTPTAERHVYEELPDDTYDMIPTDPTV
jgi:Leucine-rich repeat (LRR) protein